MNQIYYLHHHPHTQQQQQQQQQHEQQHHQQHALQQQHHQQHSSMMNANSNEDLLLAHEILDESVLMNRENLMAGVMDRHYSDGDVDDDDEEYDHLFYHSCRTTNYTLTIPAHFINYKTPEVAITPQLHVFQPECCRARSNSHSACHPKNHSNNRTSTSH